MKLMLSSFTNHVFRAASEASFGAFGNQFGSRVEDRTPPKTFGGLCKFKFFDPSLPKPFQDVIWKDFGANFDTQIAPKSSPGRSWDLLGASWGPPGGPLGASSGVLGRPGASSARLEAENCSYHLPWDSMANLFGPVCHGIPW